MSESLKLVPLVPVAVETSVRNLSRFTEWTDVERECSSRGGNRCRTPSPKFRSLYSLLFTSVHFCFQVLKLLLGGLILLVG